VLQEEWISIRNDRYVVPVKSEIKRRIEAWCTGLVPLDRPCCRAHGNHRTQRTGGIARAGAEVHRILRVTDACDDWVDAAADAVTVLDVAFAKRLRRGFDAVIRAGRWPAALTRARHPVCRTFSRRRSPSCPCPWILTARTTCWLSVDRIPAAKP
jgi:hypothetical protein